MKKNTLIEGISEGLKYLKAILKLRLSNIEAIPDTKLYPISLPNDHSPWVTFIKSQQPTLSEYICLLIAIAPHLKVGFFDEIIQGFYPKGSDLPAFGGIKGKNHRGILPTGETVQYIIAGDDIYQRLAIQHLFNSKHWFIQQGILHLEEVPQGEPIMSGRIILDAEWLERMLTGQVFTPRFSTQFPAEQLTTSLQWDDLVLAKSTATQIKELSTWMAYHQEIATHWDLHRHIKPGYRSLFYGPPGTGKTLTATLIGQNFNKAVFRIDLSMLVSKFIGETEKNLGKVFDKARNKDWILFFDEADALFGKRTDVRDAHDKYANQEVSYLLQRIEAHPGMVILASNFRSNLDDAFARRFQSIIHFHFPKTTERKLLWEKILPKEIQLDPSIQLDEIAQRYELNGSNIVNIVQYCSLQLLAIDHNVLNKKLLFKAIHREYAKEGKLM